MTSTIKVNTVTTESGSTLTIGGCGKTVALAAGASQTGFGRSGSVNWQTSIKTTDFTAASGEGYFINTTSGTITMTLPSSPSVGDIVAFKDYAGTFDTNNLTINRNGSNIIGGTINPTVSVEGQAGTLVYGDATQGWQIVEAATDSDLPRPAFIAATGGTVSTVCTNFKVHTFTGPGTFCVSNAGNSQGSNSVDYLIIAGGGGGGGGYQSGGGGAGGYRESPGSASGCYTVSPRGAAPATAITVTAQGYPIEVGGGGAGGAAASPNIVGNRGIVGVNSSALGITSAGGGPAGSFRDGSCAPFEVGGPGGSGGGAGRSPATNAGGTGNTPSVNPAQGTNGGGTTTPYASPFNGGGGGGAISPGGPGQGSCFGVGGSGATSSINATPTVRAGGGGSGGNGPTSTGGPGGAGNGASSPGNQVAAAGTANTGSGGGGGTVNPAGPSAGGAGGSGIVIIRYKFQ